MCDIDKTWLFLCTDSVENKESRITLIWMSLNDERLKKKYAFRPGLVSQTFVGESLVWESIKQFPVLN